MSPVCYQAVRQNITGSKNLHFSVHSQRIEITPKLLHMLKVFSMLIRLEHTNGEKDRLFSLIRRDNTTCTFSRRPLCQGFKHTITCYLLSMIVSVVLVCFVGSTEVLSKICNSVFLLLLLLCLTEKIVYF